MTRDALRDLVLVVDDDASVRDSLGALLETHGFETQLFPSAEALLAVDYSLLTSTHQRRRCLISDLRMTGMSGLELQAELTTRGFNVPMILVTGFADVQDVVKAMRRGAVTVLEKGCASGDIIAAVHEALAAL